MATSLERRLAKLEALSDAEDGKGVYGIPAHSDEEFEAKRAAMIAAGDGHFGDVFIRLGGTAEPAEPVTFARSVDAFFADIHARGRCIFNLSPEPAL